MKITVGISTLLFAAALMSGCNNPKEGTKTESPANNVAEPETAVQNKPADKTLLVGTWERTDAPYQIKISEVQDNGNLTASYFNPKSINVAKAIWSNAGGFLRVYVELRDENYPGSNYKLNYIAGKDALTGEYFQAVEGLTYNVAFTRVK